MPRANTGAAACALILALSWPFVATAQGSWTKQPTEVMGIRLGAPLDSAGIQPCDASNETRGRISTTTLCYQPRAAVNRPDRTFMTIHNPPDLGAGTLGATLELVHGHVAGILLSGSAARFDQIVAVLEARYGPATETVPGTARNPAGSPLSTVTKRWRGDRVYLEATRPWTSSDEFIVYWADLGTEARRAAQVSRDAESRAARL